MTEWMSDDTPNVAVLTTLSIVCDGAPIVHASHDAEDGSWQFHDDAPGAPGRVGPAGSRHCGRSAASHATRHRCPATVGARSA